ncbi:6-phosphogluconate dehydrogenase C-terminal domain-like protein [Tothia fuscella]|uniref:6-phosphogluconate dehydrogenase C-terminal domain-like protein n=1 Tax=Tothia fuscella TaxID=1048955 RepID=A0A9P4P1L5_9PEZI|nr:6-phosphogluconate dehydrogenase C-terminal domain-like protein [Tothia fuscella]
MAAPLANVGIISIGEMGLGIAKLLIANNYHVLTNLSGRSGSTKSRAESASIADTQTDTALVEQSDYILSIVPPRDSHATAERITTAFKSAKRASQHPLYFLDLNAIAPSTATASANTFPKEIRFVDGGIIGGPPKEDAGSEPADTEQASKWTKPSICLSGPYKLSEAPVEGKNLAELLNTRHVSDEIGSASGLKCCFASMTKGFTALAIQSFTTASKLGVLDQLQDYVGTHNPRALAQAERGLTSMPPKSGRWVAEMQEIGKTFKEDGGWTEGGVFEQIAEVYEFIAKETPLGEEQSGKRNRGNTVYDVVAAVEEGRGRQ